MDVQLDKLLGSSDVTAGLHRLAREADALGAGAEEALLRALKAQHAGPKRLRVSLSHTHASQHADSTGVLCPLFPDSSCLPAACHEAQHAACNQLHASLSIFLSSAHHTPHPLPDGSDLQ